MSEVEKLFEEFKGRLVEVECECDDEKRAKCVMYPEYCDGTRKEIIDLVQLIDEGLNNKLLDDKDTRIEELEKENEELREKYVKKICDCDICDTYCNSQLTKAKDLIRNLLRVTYGEGWNYSLDVKVKAEDFLKEGNNEQART